jgi:hypothetical protein
MIGAGASRRLISPSLVTVWETEAETTPEPGLSEHDQFTITLPLFQPLPFAAVRLTNVITGLVVSTMLYVAEAESLRPPPSVYEQLAVCEPRPYADSGPVTALRVAANVEFPSSVSVTAQPAVGTEPAS